MPDKMKLVPKDRLRSIRFPQFPKHDTIWSILAGKDGKIYISLCGELTGGLDAQLLSYDPAEDRLEHLADMGEVTGERGDSGHCPHSKIHFSLVCNKEGLIYGGTHCTGPPINEDRWSVFSMFTDSLRSYPGGHMFIHDPKTKETKDLGNIMPREGIRVLAIDEKRNRIFGGTYPKAHFFVYDIEKQECEDLGRVCNIEVLSLVCDSEGNAYTTDDFGYLIKCDARTLELRRLNVQLPHAPWRDGRMNWLYDAILGPDGKKIYGVTYHIDAHVFEYDPHVGEEGQIVDLGPGIGKDMRQAWLRGIASGIAFGKDGKLYYAANTDIGGVMGCHLMRLDPETKEKEDLGLMMIDGVPTQYCSRAAVDKEGNIYFAECGEPGPRVSIFNPEY